jgi:hypothetical protein
MNRDKEKFAEIYSKNGRDEQKKKKRGKRSELSIGNIWIGGVAWWHKKSTKHRRDASVQVRVQLSDGSIKK